MFTVQKSTLLILRVLYIVYYIIFHPYIILSQTTCTVEKSTSVLQVFSDFDYSRRKGGVENWVIT